MNARGAGKGGEAHNTALSFTTPTMSSSSITATFPGGANDRRHPGGDGKTDLSKTNEILTQVYNNSNIEKKELDDMDLDLDMLLDSENSGLDMLMIPPNSTTATATATLALVNGAKEKDEEIDTEARGAASAKEVDDLDLDLLLGSENDEDLGILLGPSYTSQQNSQQKEENDDDAQSNLVGDDDDDNAGEAQLQHDIQLAESKYTAESSTEPRSSNAFENSVEGAGVRATHTTKSVTETAVVSTSTSTAPATKSNSLNHAPPATAHGHGDFDEDSTLALSSAMSAPCPFDFHHKAGANSSRFATPQRKRVQQQQQQQAQKISGSCTVQSTRSSPEKFTSHFHHDHEHYYADHNNNNYAGMSVYESLYADAWNRKRDLERRQQEDKKRLEQACSFVPDISASIQSYESSPHMPKTTTTTTRNDKNVVIVKESVFDRLYRSRKPPSATARSRSCSTVRARTPSPTRAPSRTRQQQAFLPTTTKAKPSPRRLLSKPPPTQAKPSPRSLLSNPPPPPSQKQSAPGDVPTKASVAYIKDATHPRAAAKVRTAAEVAATTPKILDTTSTPSKDTTKHVLNDKDATPLEPLVAANDVATLKLPEASTIPETSTESNDTKNHESPAAATRIQTCWRQRTEMQKYHALQAKFILLQAVIRGQQGRSKTATMMKNTEAAQSLQTCWRRHKAMSDFNKARDSAVLLQAVMRSIQCRELRKEENIMHNLCATQIQTCWRQRNAMKKHHALQLKLIRCMTNWNRVHMD